MTSKERLVTSMAGAGVPVDTVTVTGPASADVTYMPWATPEQVQAGAVFLANYDWSDAAELAWTRAKFAARLDATDAQFALLRGLVAVLVDEVNALRQWDVSLKAATAGAATLAAFKTAVAALPNMPDRTLDQARDAVKSKVTDGAA